MADGRGRAADIGNSLDEIIRERRRSSQRAEPYSLYSADLGKAGKRSDKRPPGRGLDGTTLVGCVKSFNPKKAWGFLQSEAVPSRDIFLHIRECVAAGGVPGVGDVLEFELGHTEEGNPYAIAARPLEKASAWQDSQKPRPWVQQGVQALPPPPGPKAAARGLAALPTGSSQVGAAGADRGGRGRTGARAVRIMNFPWTMTWQEIRDAFLECGDVLRVELDAKKVGQAIITFRDAATAQRAVEEYDGGWFNGRELRVVFEK